MNGVVANTESRQAASWISSPSFDLAFFILSPLTGLAVVLAYPIGGFALTLAAATLVGGPHYLATYSFYFWDDTAAHRRERWAAYFLGPLVIMGAVGAVALMHLPAVISMVIYFWNALHVSRQSCGILSIYRFRAGERERIHRTVSNIAILNVSFAMLLSRPDWYPLVGQMLRRVWPPLVFLLPQVMTSLAAASLVALAWSLLRRRRDGKPADMPELAFLATSLLLFHPYLWVHDPNLATLGMLMGHFLQYLGIVWLVNRRKFAEGHGSSGQRAIARLWGDPKFLVPSLALAGGLFLLLQVNLAAVTITLVLIHFYLDGLFWAFSRPAIRNAFGPCLLSHKTGPSERLM